MNKTMRAALVWAAVLLVSAATSEGVILFLDLGDATTGVQGGPMDDSNPTAEAYAGQTVELHL